MNFNIDIQTIAVMKASEDYDNLAQSFKDVFETINYLIEHPTVEVNGQLYPVEWGIFITAKPFKFSVLSTAHIHA